MSLFSAIRIALSALFIHKGRSVLTSLGIIIGIGAVIAMVSAADGARRKLDDRLSTVGKNLILVRAGARTQSGAIADLTPLKNSDAELIRKHLNGRLRGVAEAQMTRRTVSTGQANWTTAICGTSPEMAQVREWVLASGRYFNAEEFRGGAPVCVIGETVRRKLFAPGEPVVGQTLRMDRLKARIVGVLAPKGRNPLGQDQDDEIFLPLPTLQKKLVGEERIHSILTAVEDASVAPQIMNEITRLLRESHRVKEGREDFDVSSIQELANLGFVITDTLRLLMAMIAALSLLVGGIGIMNIMLVSVTERTREIGLRMAIGARPVDVLTQFLLEAIVLALLGGLIGVSAGIGTAVLLSRLADWPVLVSPLAVLAAFGVAAGVGVFFGFYPAWKASRLDPIEALRHE